MKTVLLILLCIPVIGFISCQDDSRVDDLQREIEDLKQNSSELEANNDREKEELARKEKEEKQTRLEEKFPANTYAVATQKRVYFHSKPDKATKLKSFIVSGQYCTVEKVKNGFGYISFVYKNKTTRGWLNLKYIEPYELQPEDKWVGVYKLVGIDGFGDNCNCGCGMNIVGSSTWEHQGTFACELPYFKGVKEVNDYLNSFKIQFNNDNTFNLIIDNTVAFSGVYGKEILNVLTYKFKKIESSNSNYVLNGLLWGTLDSVKNALLIGDNDDKNTVNLSFKDGGTDYTLYFKKN